MIVDNQVDLFLAELIAEAVIVLFLLVIAILVVLEARRKGIY